MSTSGGTVVDPLNLANEINPGDITTPRTVNSDSSGAFPALISGDLQVAYFRSRAGGPRNTVKIVTAATAPTAGTLAKVGVYSVDGVGNLTLLAACANKVSFPGTFAVQTCALLSTVTLVPGVIYGLGIIQVAGTVATIQGIMFQSVFAGDPPPLAHHAAGFADIPANVAIGALSLSTFSPYASLVP